MFKVNNRNTRTAPLKLLAFDIIFSESFHGFIDLFAVSLSVFSYNKIYVNLGQVTY